MVARKTKEDALETRSQLLDAAEKVFFEKGFGQASLADIADAASLSRGAIYWHFKNKIDLFEAMSDRIRLPLENLTDICADLNEPDPLGKLRDFWVQALKDITHNPRRRRVLAIVFFKCELNKDAKQLETRRQAAQLEYVNDIKNCLQSAIDKGQLPKKLDTDKAAVANHALLIGLISSWVFLPGSFDLNSYAASMIDGYLFMLKNSLDLRSS